METEKSEGPRKANLPWVEKYRPNALQELISHDDIVKTIRKFISQDKLPHLLFYGPPGTGKTSTILACAKEIYSPKQFNSMVLELNASDDRGINVVRGQILSFASTRFVHKSREKTLSHREKLINSVNLTIFFSLLISFLFYIPRRSDSRL